MMLFLIAILALAVVAILAPAVFGTDQGPQHRQPLAGPDDQDLDFTAALRAGPLPPYSDEREERW